MEELGVDSVVVDRRRAVPDCKAVVAMMEDDFWDGLILCSRPDSSFQEES